MAGVVTELLERGRKSVFESIAPEVPASLVAVTRIPGLGPKKARRLWDELGVETIDDLEVVAREGRVAALEGFGLKNGTTDP